MYDGGMWSPRGRWTVWCVATLATVPAAWAQAPAPAVVWYRSSPDCPGGAEFLVYLGERSALVRLAKAGDRPDFVVTLAATPKGATGRLERQTRGGIVAIRELQAKSCELVSRALALNLSLAVVSEGRDVQASTETPLPSPDDAPPSLPPGDTAPPSPQAERRPSRSSPPVQRGSSWVATPGTAGTRLGRSEPTSFWAAGLQGGLTSGIAPSPLAFAVLFVEHDGALVQAVPDLAVRAAAFGVVGSTTTAGKEIGTWVLGGRLDLCPVRLGDVPLSLWGCAAMNLGAIGAYDGQRAVGPWAALGTHGRLVWWTSRWLSLEGEVGATVALFHHEITAGTAVLYRTEPAGLFAALGAAMRFP